MINRESLHQTVREVLDMLLDRNATRCGQDSEDFKVECYRCGPVIRIDIKPKAVKS